MKTIKEILAGITALTITFIFASLQFWAIYFILVDLLNSSLQDLINFAGIYILISVICYKSLQALKPILNLSL